jgi:hypothetical protein
MVEVKTHRDHPASMEQRIRDRLKNSGGQEADFTTQVGSGPTRLFHNSHNSANMRQHGPDGKGERGIDGKARGPANTRGQY